MSTPALPPRPVAQDRRALLRARFEPLLRTLGATVIVGAVLGALVGGVGGRLAMRLLFLTTGPSVRGVISDDGFEIGRVSVDTFNLIGSTALFGILGAFIYLAARPFLPRPTWLRSLCFGVASGLTMGTAVVVPDGVDFAALSPVPLAFALFVAIPALFGALIPLALEPTLEAGGWPSRRPLWALLVPLAVFAFPPLTVMIGLPVAAVEVTRYASERRPRLAALVAHPALLWLGRGAWLALVLLASAALLEDARALL